MRFSKYHPYVFRRVATTSFTVPSNGTYWIAAVYSYLYNGTTYTAYSKSWVDIDVEMSSIITNVIATYDEKTLGWLGSKSEYAYINSNGYLSISGGGKISTIPIVSKVSDIFWYGGVGNEGIYTIPESHMITLASAELCNVSCTFAVKVISAYNKVSSWPKVSEITSVSGDDPTKGNCIVQINIKGTNDEWGGWQDFYPGAYLGKAFNFRLKLTSADSQFTVVVTDFSFSVDVEDKTESKNVTIPVEGLTITYDAAFNMVPNPVVSIYEKQEGDREYITNQSNSGFTITITNNGIAVSRRINYVAVGW
jgi:hypothetical protein